MALQDASEIDYEAALDICEDDEDLLISIVECFVEEWTARKNHIEELFLAKEWEDYRTNVHALKGSSLNMGCTGLSADAKAIEQAVKNGDIEFAISHHADLMNRLSKTLKELEENLE